VLAYFDQPGTSNGQAEAINGLLEHLKGTARDTGIWATTSSGRCWTRESTDRFYTLVCDEPLFWSV
jgi:hypothetical protein